MLVSDEGPNEDLSTWRAAARGSGMRDGGGRRRERDEAGVGRQRQQGEWGGSREGQGGGVVVRWRRRSWVVAAGVGRVARQGGGQNLEEERGRGMGRLRGATRTSYAGPTCQRGERSHGR